MRAMSWSRNASSAGRAVDAEGIGRAFDDFEDIAIVVGIFWRFLVDVGVATEDGGGPSKL